jgi:hypothetical protein
LCFSSKDEQEFPIYGYNSVSEIFQLIHTFYRDYALTNWNYETSFLKWLEKNKHAWKAMFISAGNQARILGSEELVQIAAELGYT